MGCGTARCFRTSNASFSRFELPQSLQGERMIAESDGSHCFSCANARMSKYGLHPSGGTLNDHKQRPAERRQWRLNNNRGEGR
jgi:hypothetical protein